MSESHETAPDQAGAPDAEEVIGEGGPPDAGWASTALPGAARPRAGEEGEGQPHPPATARRVTPAQAAARAANGKKHSTGPVTPEGKEKSKVNAATHGGYSLSPVISNGLLNESVEEYGAFRERIIRSLHAEGPAESELAGTVADLFWRGRRPAAYEAAFLARESAKSVSFDLAHIIRWMPMKEAAVTVLTSPDEPHSTSDLEFAAIQCGHVVGLEMADDWPKPKPADQQAWNDLISATISEAGRTREYVLERVERELAKARSEADRLFVQEREAMAARVVEDDLLLRITRVEAHLGREISRAITLLRTLQAGRKPDEDDA